MFVLARDLPRSQEIVSARDRSCDVAAFRRGVAMWAVASGEVLHIATMVLEVIHGGPNGG